MDESLPLFTEQQLRRYDGENGPMYVAYQGIVYDVTDCSRWKTGLHEHLHFPGLDLSGELQDAPHGDEVFLRPCIKIVGHLDSAPTRGER
jgi:predicted heme/steroid binding protein